MAKKINVYPLIRSIHFYAAAVSGIFLLLYFITGFLLVKHHWFAHESAEEKMITQGVDIPSFKTEWELAKWAKKTTQLNGKIDWINTRQNGITEVEILTPSEFHLIQLFEEQDSLIHTYHPHNPHEQITVMHRMHGYGGGRIYDFYMLGMDIACIALLLFVITGIYLWLKLLKRRWFGYLMLIAGLSYTTWVIFTFTH